LQREIIADGNGLEDLERRGVNPMGGKRLRATYAMADTV